jgi:alkyl hydroperoxide reductase subunit AhpF
MNLQFNKNGELVVDANTPEAIRAAFEAVEAAKAAADAAVIAVAHGVERQDAASKYLAANFKPRSFLDEFRGQTTFAQATRGRS